MSKTAVTSEKAVKPPLADGLYAHPFSLAYWKEALKELTKVRMLAVAAILIAVRVALKGVSIPVVPPTLMITFGFFVNALGSMIYGPVLALITGAISDTLGAILFPSGVYFFPFIFTEMAGSLIFALFLYRAPMSSLRIILSRFCVIFFVNIVLQAPIMLAYYDVVLGKPYALFDLPRICKNLVLFPFEALLLMLFLELMVPLTYRMKLTYDQPKKFKLTKKLVALILVLFLVGSAATAAYTYYDYNTRNHATSFESETRAEFNQMLADYIDADEQTLVLVNTVSKTAFKDEMTVTFTVYDVAQGTDMSELWALKNSAAKGDKYKDCLTVRTTGTATLNKKDNSLLTYALDD